MRARNNFVTGLDGATYRRASCLRCGGVLVWLGEALVVDGATCSPIVAHICRGCQRSGAAGALVRHVTFAASAGRRTA